MSSLKNSRDWYQRNLEQERERGREKYRKLVGTVDGCVRNLLSGAKTRSKKKGLPFDLDATWLRPKIEAGKCEVTGVPFDYSVTNAFRFYGATVDRIVPALGYTQSNCQVVIWGYNAAKGNATHKDVMQLARALIANDN